MTIRTRLTELFGLQTPIILAPMGGVSGGRLAAAVASAGGLGLVGGGYGDRDWLARELELAARDSRGAWGVGFITWSVDAELVRFALDFHPNAVMLSFGDPAPLAPVVREAGCRLICQVQDLAGARAARAAGADAIVAQGTEAGGHGAARATLPLVPAVADAVAPVPVVAAGGITDGRGLAAVLALGAEGALLGTRFYAAHESLGHSNAKALIAAAAGDGTRRTRVFDVIRGYDWPEPFTGRALCNAFVERWHGREDELRTAAATEGPAFQRSLAEGDFSSAMVWAGEGVDLIHEVGDAAGLVQRIGAEAEVCLRRVGDLVAPTP